LPAVISTKAFPQSLRADCVIGGDFSQYCVPRRDTSKIFPIVNENQLGSF